MNVSVRNFDSIFVIDDGDEKTVGKPEKKKNESKQKLLVSGFHMEISE